MQENRFDVTKRVEETNFNIVSKNIDIYPADYSFPLKTGDKFPDDKLKERASMSLTNRLLLNNNYSEVFSTYLSDMNNINLSYGMQIREIVTQLPFFKKTVEGMTGLALGNKVLFDFPDVTDNSADSIVHSSNIYEAMRSIFESDFMDACSLYKVTCNNLGEPIIEQIPVKNFIVYNDPYNISSVYCYLTFSIVSNRIEFIEYRYDGQICKRVFAYGDGAIGKELCEPEYTYAFNGKYKEAPVVLFRNNVENMNDTYGDGRFNRFDSAVLAVCKSFSNLLSLNEKAKDITKVVPESAISRTSIGGIMLNRGVVSYNENLDASQRPDIRYVSPDIRNNIEAGIEVFKQSVKTLAMSSGLSHIFYDFEKVGTGVLSGKALESMMMPTLLNVNKLCEDKTRGVKELVHKLCLLQGMEIPISRIDIDFNQGIPKDEKEQAEIINMRLQNKTISIVDAIRVLDRVPVRVAKEQANKILGLFSNSNNIEESVNNEDSDISNNSVLNFCPENTEEESNKENGRTIADVEMPFTPRNISL